MSSLTQVILLALSNLKVKKRRDESAIYTETKYSGGRLPETEKLCQKDVISLRLIEKVILNFYIYWLSYCDLGR